MKTKSLLVFLLITLFALGVSAQNKAKFRLANSIKLESTVGYNFFVGTNAADFSSSIKGFGSGLMDAFAGRTSVDLVSFGTKNLNLSLGAGFNVSKFRFAENQLLSLTNGVVNWAPDANPDHDYVNTFFGYGKTKLVNTSVYVPLDLNIRFGENVLASVGGFVDYSIHTKFKSKYLEGDNKVKELITNADMKNYNLNKLKYGLSAKLYHKKLEAGLSFTYYLTPFFQTDLGPDLTEVRIALLQGMGTFSEMMAKGNK